MTTAVKDLQVTSSGLTTATTAYSALDQVGALFTFTNFATGAGLGGLLTGITLVDETAIIGGYTAWVFGDTPTPASDNAAFSISDADAEKLAMPPVALGPVFSGTLNKTVGWSGAQGYACVGTSLYVLLQTNGAHTFFGAGTSLKLRLNALTI